MWLLQAKSLQSLRLFATLWVIALQAPLSMGFSRQEYWSGLPFPPPGDLPDPGMEPESFAGYQTQEITPVDMFPRTAHVESVALVVKQS